MKLRARKDGIEELEIRLRNEAKEWGEGPSPRVKSRILAEVSASGSGLDAGRGWSWAGVLAGSLAVVFAGMVGIHRLARSHDQGSPVAAHRMPWHEFVGRTDAVSAPLQEVVADPFRGELDALASDTQQARRFLTACIPL